MTSCFVLLGHAAAATSAEVVAPDCSLEQLTGPGELSAPAQADHCIRLNQIQVLGTHNSYKQALLPQLVTVLDQTRLGWSRDIAYQHRPLTYQLQQLGIRQFELDIFADPDGGLYARPAGAVLVDDQAYIDIPAMHQPGFKVLHSQDTDYRSSCLSLQDCLNEIQRWSQANPEHLPIMIMLEMKEGNRPDFGPIKYTEPVPIDAALLLQVDALIRQVFPPAQLITPDEVRGDYASLAEAVVQQGWPTLAASRGRVLLAMDNTGSHHDAYLAGAKNLAGRAMFVSSRPGEPTAAFIKMNDVLAEYDLIREYVAAGFLVRTRADIPTREARSGSTERRDLALASGAQYISTDYPEPSPFNADYQVSLPGASSGPGRCNPVSALPGCRPEWLAETVPQSPR
ncbi:MAG: phosphatidylinositol-specific phospholipase C1-like protein [Pseudomonadales bacterium]|nr:phosphatidylinositol-specific phospholipase C1-like protein [Pseudomonadales bacterium]